MSKNLDLIIEGNILTMADDRPIAKAVGIRQGLITALGDISGVAAGAGESTRYLHLENKTIVPGFIDTHMHPSHVGALSINLDLAEARSIKEILHQITKRADEAPTGQLIQALNFNYQIVREHRLPTRTELDDISEQHPIIIVVYDIHSGMFNTKALKMLALPDDTEGLVRGADGAPTGLLVDPAITMALKQIAPKSEADLMPAIQVAAREALRAGITTAHMKDSPLIMDIILKNEADIPVRIKPIFMFNPEDLEMLPGILDNPKLKSRAVVAFFADGSPDSRTAACFHPYPDDASNFGMLYYTNENLEKIVEKSHSAGFQVSVHACGARAGEQVLTVYEKVLQKNPRSDHRHRLEHFEKPLNSQIRRAVAGGFVLCMQPMFLFFAGPDTFQKEVDFFGLERTCRWKPFRTIMDMEGLIAGGSDAPVTRMSPLNGIAACVNHPNKVQRITAQEALRMFTINGARAGFEEHLKGSIEPGKLADFTVLSENPLSVGEDKIGDIRVEMTIVGGEIKYESG